MTMFDDTCNAKPFLYTNCCSTLTILGNFQLIIHFFTQKVGLQQQIVP